MVHQFPRRTLENFHRRWQIISDLVASFDLWVGRSNACCRICSQQKQPKILQHIIYLRDSFMLCLCHAHPQLPTNLLALSPGVFQISSRPETSAPGSLRCLWQRSTVALVHGTTGGDRHNEATNSSQLQALIFRCFPRICHGMIPRERRRWWKNGCIQMLSPTVLRSRPVTAQQVPVPNVLKQLVSGQFCDIWCYVNGC